MTSYFNAMTPYNIVMTSFLNAKTAHLASLDGLDFPSAGNQLNRLRRLVRDLHLIHENVLIFEGIALLRIVLAAHLHPAKRR